MGKIIGLIGKGIKRAVTKDGGGIATIKSITGEKDNVYWIAMAVRVFAPVVIIAIAYLIASLAGVPVSEVIDNINNIDI